MASHRYFIMTWGLRGCYMPDGEPVAIMVKTRRELKQIVADQAGYLATETTEGFAKRAISRFVADCWREAAKDKPAYLPFALPYRERGQTHYPYGIFVSVSSRSEYREHTADND